MRSGARRRRASGRRSRVAAAKLVARRRRPAGGAGFGITLTRSGATPHDHEVAQVPARGEDVRGAAQHPVAERRSARAVSAAAAVLERRRRRRATAPRARRRSNAGSPVSLTHERAPRERGGDPAAAEHAGRVDDVGRAGMAPDEQQRIDVADPDRPRPARPAHGIGLGGRLGDPRSPRPRPRGRGSAGSAPRRARGSPGRRRRAARFRRR